MGSIAADRPPTEIPVHLSHRSVLFTMQRAFAATLVAAAATRVGASKWPLRAT